MMIGAEGVDQEKVIPAYPVVVWLHLAGVFQREDLQEWVGAVMEIQEECLVPVPAQLQEEAMLHPAVDSLPWIPKQEAGFLQKEAGRRTAETTAAGAEAVPEVVGEAAQEEVVEELRAHLHEGGAAGKIPEGCAKQ
jgi:hypothetical protein